MNKKILNIALPAIVSNITVPLLALVDVAIAGHLGERTYIGALALGGLFFNVLYLNFGFLRMSTSGFAAQAFGRRDKKHLLQVLLQALALAVAISCFILILQYPIEKTFFYFLDTTAEMEAHTRDYVRILLWGAPAVLCLYVFYGWFVGVQNARYQMYVAVSANLINLITSLYFVYAWDMGIKGVALGTLIAQYFALFFALALWLKSYAKLSYSLTLSDIFTFSGMKRIFGVNRDIFFRTLCLVSVMSFFSYSGSRQGETVLAINTLLLQLFTLFSYFIDGFAYSGEALVGKYLGAGDKKSVKELIRLLFIWGSLLALSFFLVYLLGGKHFLLLLTNDRELVQESQRYFFWALAIPLVSFAAFVWDGVYIGATATRYMLISAFVSALSFFCLVGLFSGLENNHVLWFSFLLYLFLRGVLQTVFAPRVLRRAFV